ncbi:MAG: thioredoxin fold domain-containing protein [Gammaproteobacteria bacterium]
MGSNLQADAEIADSRRLPILLVFSAIDCTYCELLEEEFLEPMLLGGEYKDRVIIRKVILDNGSRLTDFNGQRRDATAFSDQYKVFVTPTLLFVDGDGTELTGRMLGINTLELFGGYLDDCIETALLNVRGIDASQWPASCLNTRQR